MILIKNAQCLGKYLNQSQEVVKNVYLIIKNKKIDFIGTSLDRAEAHFSKVIDAKNMLMTPGLFDPQVHFREPGQEHKEDIESGARAANKGGFTSVVAMPNTNPVADSSDVIKMMLDRSNSLGLCRVFPTSALSYGLRGEKICDYEKLKAAGAIAITDDGKGVQRDEVFLDALSKAKSIGLPILDHSEDEKLSNGGAINLGEISKKYAVKGIDPLSEAIHVKRGCEMSGVTGAHYHALHVSTKESFDYIREAKRKGFKVTCEVSPHHLCLCDEDIKVLSTGILDANYKMNPPLRSRENMLAAQKALSEGVIDAIATDHAPHSVSEKKLSIQEAPFGIIGLESAFPILYTRLVCEKNLISLTELVSLMSEKPADIFGLNHLGRLAVNGVADLAFFDLDELEVIDENFFKSKSKNSPFIGEKLKGVCKMTIFEGKIVYQDLK